MPLALIHAGYGRRLKAIDIQFQPREFIGIIGGNAAGKSTLAQLLVGALLPDQGEVRLDDWRTHIPSELHEIHKRVALVRADPEAQIIAPTVREEICFGLRAEGLSLAEINERTDEVLNEFELQSLADLHPFSLSTGELCRVTLAAQVVRQPRYLILDEFTHMLDSITRVRMLNWLHKHRRQTGTTIILITHRLEELRSADRAIVLVDGSFVAEATIPELYHQFPAHPEWRVDLPILMQLAFESVDPRLSAWRLGGTS